MILISLLSILLVLNFSPPAVSEENLIVSPAELEISLEEVKNVTYESKIPLVANVLLFFDNTSAFEIPQYISLNASTGVAVLPVRGKQLTSRVFLEVSRCKSLSSNGSACPFDLSSSFVRVTVYKSHVIDWLVNIVGWMYFLAWSVSFYPQILLNFRRKSVIGLNFDFLLLNLIGFTAYSCYNVFIYFDPYVQEEYEAKHPRSPIPVLLNDVVFAVHATFACLVTIIQCFIYERSNQRVSRLASGIATVLVVVGFVMAVLSSFHTVSVLTFVNSLSYLKMTVTLLKYFPQAFFNFQRKSTVGWSIGNVLLDFTGGTLDILQMILQAINVNDWSAFYGNPVKFGLGLVSIIFDIIFIIQHYILYKSADIPHGDYSGIVSPQPPEPQAYGAANDDNDHEAIVVE